jgi:hypothetical protein
MYCNDASSRFLWCPLLSFNACGVQLHHFQRSAFDLRCPVLAHQGRIDTDFTIVPVPLESRNLK